MSRFVRFLLVLVPFSLSFAITPRDLHKTVHEVKNELRLTEWHVIAHSLSPHDMVVTNKCDCFGESITFSTSRVAVVNILDDEAYKELGWTDLKAIHAH